VLGPNCYYNAHLASLFQAPSFKRLLCDCCISLEERCLAIAITALPLRAVLVNCLVGPALKLQKVVCESSHQLPTSQAWPATWVQLLLSPNVSPAESQLLR
jgi:hypothetical protein